MAGNRICLLDSACGPGLAVLEGGLKAVTTQTALDFHRRVVGDVAAASGVYYGEVIFWSASRIALTNLVSFGIAQIGGPLDKYVGEDANSYGWRFADGRIDNNGAAVVSGMDVQAERKVFGFWLSLSPGSATLAFAIGAYAIASVTLPTGKTWLPAFTIAGPTAGDVRFQVNFGQYLFDTPIDPTGWNEQTPGLSTFHVSLVTEAFMSAHTDSPADTSYLPDLINTDFSIRRSVLPWPHRTDEIDRSVLPSAFSPLIFRNPGGRYSPLLFADTRGSIVTLDTIDAPPMSQGSLTNAVRMFTANIDSVLAPDASTIQINLKDNIARMDVTMPMRIVPDFYDASAAGKVCPWSIGVVRNANPLTLDAEALLYLMGDMPFTNVPLVMDMGAPLDPLAPQYVPALQGRAFTLLQEPEGKISFDGSTLGTQYTAGVADILGGIGAFTTWTTGVPNGWVKAATPTFPSSVVNNGTIAQVAFGTHASALRMTSNVPYTPSGVGFFYGYPITVGGGIVLRSGMAYRVSLNLLACTGIWPEKYGIAVLAGAADDSRYWISPFHEPLNEAGIYSFQFRVPPEIGTVVLGLWCISKFGGTAPTTQTCIATIDDVVVEELGQYNDVPMLGPTLDDALKDILVRHCNEPASIYSSADAAAVHNATVTADAPRGYVWGIRRTEPANVPDTIQEILDVYGALQYTDEFNVWRFDRFIAPEDGTPICLFDDSNIDPDEEFSINADTARALTRLYGARRNCDPNGGSDFVSDTDRVPPDRRQQLSGISQFDVEATVQPANEYLQSRGAPRFHTLHDDKVLCQIEGNRMLRVWAQRVVSGLVLSGKRSIVKLTARYTGLSLGSGSLIVQPQKLYPCKIVTVNKPDKGINSLPAVVLSTELVPLKRKITVEVLL